MSVRRRTLSALVGIAATLAVAPVPPASAHGAPTSPISRATACAGGGTKTALPVCRAARVANDRAFGGFDNVRLPDVAGRDRQVIPDGQLCSAGLAQYRGLDLARRDWPTSGFTAGDTVRLRYRATIPHRGSFRIYLTRPGWVSSRPLRWSDLDPAPIRTVVDPPLRDGAYRMSVPLPTDRVGRHLLYAVWQTSDTPDTYYSCSDVVLTRAGARGAAGGGTPTTTAPATTAPADTAAPGRSAAGSPDASDGAPAAGAGGSAAAVAGRGTGRDRGAGRPLLGAALLVLAGVVAGLAVAVRRRRARVSTRGTRHPQRY